MTKKKRLMYELISFVLTFLISLTSVLLITSYIVRPVSVEGLSMYPTLNDEDIAVSSRMFLDKDSIERFDIVVIKLENEDKYIVKRVIGLPNETIKIEDDILYVDGLIVDEPFLDTGYVIAQQEEDTYTSDVEEITLGNEEFYLMGDNRSHSLDSRYYGAFDASSIVSRHIFVLFPFDHFGMK